MKEPIIVTSPPLSYKDPCLRSLYDSMTVTKYKIGTTTNVPTNELLIGNLIWIKKIHKRTYILHNVLILRSPLKSTIMTPFPSLFYETHYYKLIYLNFTHYYTPESMNLIRTQKSLLITSRDRGWNK